MDKLAASAIVQAVTLSKNPSGYWRLNDLLNVAKDSSGHAHDGTIQGYADLVKSKGASLLGYWRLEEAAGLVAADSSANTHPGTISGGVVLGTAGPLLDPDLAYTFDGLTGAIAVGNSAALATPAGNQWGVECWFKIPALPAAPAELVRRDNSGLGYALRIRTTGKVEGWVGFSDATSGGAAGATTVTTGVWHHAVLTYDGAAVRIYLDGQQDGSSAVVKTLSFQAASLYLAVYNGTAEFLTGQLDEVAIYNTALTAAEVLSHYNAGLVTRPVARGIKGALPGDPSSAAMSFDGVIGAIVTDDTGNAFDFTTQFSVAAWVNLATIPAIFGGIASKYQADQTGWDFSIQNLNGKPRMTVRGTSNLDTGNGGGVVNVSDGLWHHIAAVITNAQILLYVDGLLVQTVNGTWTPVTNAQPVRLGMRSPLSPNLFKGSIADVSIFGYALSSADISDLYLAGKQALGSFASTRSYALT